MTGQGEDWNAHLPILLRSGYSVAPDELQGHEAPRPPTRSLTNIMV
jgi:hypothetical protein